MFASTYSNRYILSSSCPYSRSLVDFAARIGGILDPKFLMQCEITDRKLQKMIEGLKQIPLNCESLSTSFNFQEELYLDMDIPYQTSFYDSWQFRQHNSWLNNRNQRRLSSKFKDDLII